MSVNNDTIALAGALGSIIGYLGAEAAEPSTFERLLWPQRYYNQTSLAALVKSVLLMPMGGPLHKAALQVLVDFRRKGLYGGMQQGHMLGTAFFPNSKLKYKLHAYQGKDFDMDVRNGLWVRVLQSLRDFQSNRIETPSVTHDEESVRKDNVVIRRTSQRVQHLKLSVPKGSALTATDVRQFNEDHITVGAIITIFASELTAIGCSLVIFSVEGCHWFSAYMLAPLLLKLLSIPASVRREPATKIPRKVETEDLGDVMLVEVDNYEYGFPLIEGPEQIVRHFFRHWGHPVRKDVRDRIRELVSMGIVMTFVLCFPFGLLSMLWVSQPVQVVWLSYQMYTIIAMHINLLVGVEGPGRIEDGMAQQLARGKIVRLTSSSGDVIDAKLESHIVARLAYGQELVRQLVRKHAESVPLMRTNSDSSQASTLNEKSQ